MLAKILYGQMASFLCVFQVTALMRVIHFETIEKGLAPKDVFGGS